MAEVAESRHGEVAARRAPLLFEECRRRREHDRDPEALARRAGRGLYAAKDCGRNRIVADEDVAPMPEAALTRRPATADARSVGDDNARRRPEGTR